jgi:EAL and modified HD-GYP domain-containing signal transduction protein
MPDQTQDSLYSDIFFARQPIFDRGGSIWGYELLYRKSADCRTAQIDDYDLATACVATAGLVCPDTDYKPSKRIFINYTEKLLLNGAPKGLPPGITVVEVLESVTASPEVIKAIIELKQEGYLIAIDDFRGEASLSLLMEYADIIKVDLLGLELEQIAALISQVPDRVLTLAEKVEDPAQVPYLQEMGFDLFQGYYFAHPQTISGKKLSATSFSKLKTLTLLEQQNATPQDYTRLIERDPSIAFRLLRLLNSAAFCFSVKIKSIQHAISLLGMMRLKYWLRMVVLSDVGARQITPELYRMSIVRARFFELLLAEDPDRKALEPDSLFLFGLLSLLDVMLDVGMDQLLPILSLQEPLARGLETGQGHFGHYLQLAIAIETADSEAISRQAQVLRIEEHLISSVWRDAMLWGNEVEQQTEV